MQQDYSFPPKTECVSSQWFFSLYFLTLYFPPQWDLALKFPVSVTYVQMRRLDHQTWRIVFRLLENVDAHNCLFRKVKEDRLWSPVVLLINKLKC